MFLAGAVVGISLFSTLLRWLLRMTHDLAILGLTRLGGRLEASAAHEAAERTRP